MPPIYSRITPVCDSYAFDIEVVINDPGTHRTLVLAIDCSGSMSGLPIEYGRFATVAALRKAVTDFDDVVLIMYNHTVQEIVVNKANIDAVVRRVKSWRSSGWTDFIKVFQSIQKILLQRQSEYKNKIDLRVAFFTDGHHYTGDYGGAYTLREEHDRRYGISIQDMQTALKKFITVMKDSDITDAGGGTTIVARGYSDSNDLDVLHCVSGAGSTKGTYRYATTAKDIFKIMAHDEVLSGKRVSAKLRVVTPYGTTDYHFDLSEINSTTESSHTHRGSLFIPKHCFGDVDECKVSLVIDEVNHVVPFDAHAQTPITEVFSIVSHYCGLEILAAAQDVVAMNASGGSVTASKHRLRDLIKYLDIVWCLIQKTNVRTLRERLSEDFKSMKTQIHGMNDLFEQLSLGGATNDHMSQLLNAGHRVAGEFARNK